MNYLIWALKFLALAGKLLPLLDPDSAQHGELVDRIRAVAESIGGIIGQAPAGALQSFGPPSPEIQAAVRDLPTGEDLTEEGLLAWLDLKAAD